MPRQRFIQDPVTHELIPADEWYSRPDPSAPFVIPDISPYKSMATGEMVTSRSAHREHLKRHGLVEIGNEVKHHLSTPKKQDNREERRRAIAEVLNGMGY